MPSEGPRIERDGGCIKLIANENTYIEINRDSITLNGNIIIKGSVDIENGADGIICGTSIAAVKNGIITGIKY